MLTSWALIYVVKAAQITFRAFVRLSINFNLVQAELRIFGQKDIQQFKIIERMVNDLFIPVKLKMVKTVDNSDGLALSSRNKYLSVEQRQHALIVPQVIAFIVNQIIKLVNLNRN